MPGTRAAVVWPGREADAPLRTPRSRQSPFCRDESRPDNLIGARGEIRTHVTGFAIQRLIHLATRAIGTEGEIRTLESSLEDSHVSSYITSADAGRAARAGSGVRTLELLAGLGPAASTFEASRSSI